MAESWKKVKFFFLKSSNKAKCISANLELEIQPRRMAALGEVTGRKHRRLRGPRQGLFRPSCMCVKRFWGIPGIILAISLGRLLGFGEYSGFVEKSLGLFSGVLGGARGENDAVLTGAESSDRKTTTSDSGQKKRRVLTGKLHSPPPLFRQGRR